MISPRLGGKPWKCQRYLSLKRQIAYGQMRGAMQCFYP
jgi:hypothetical protein